MILTKATEAEAQELADRCHAYLIANDQAYAASVAAGQTLQWAIPTLVYADSELGFNDQPGLVVGWSVPVNERVFGCLTAEEYTPPDPPALI